MATRIRQIGSVTLARRIASFVVAIVLLAAVALMQPGASAKVETNPTAASQSEREVALLVPRRIRLIINYHKPREA